MSEIQKKMDSDLFPSATFMKCLGILANDKVIKWENMIVSWPQ